VGVLLDELAGDLRELGLADNYLSAAIGKLGARNRNEAIEMAADQGWL
jgi:hypothetical protein